ncbi:MAG TPA: nucleotide sugar dehydrogenase [Aquificales bacterium]|nr:nucleotide sugar dehydrogenase [Aquificales bacterium]
MLKETTIAVVGLGYVGLPLAVALAKHFPVIGLDINSIRIEELKKGIDRTGEVESKDILNPHIVYTTDEKLLKDANVIIVTVPTPTDRYRNPDLRFLKRATQTVGRNLKKGTIVVYESTVFPGCTEEVCVPILEKESGLTWKRDFFVGYSPERINPGDKKHRLENIVKVVAGDTPETAKKIAAIYSKVIKAGVHIAPSIKVAEAAKVIENTQRDINIALMNELAMLFDKLGIDTREVLEAAGTKWNFLKVEPGLVGGHCIPEDPYYLAYKAQEVGFHPQLILSGRRINDYIPIFIAQKVVKLLIKAGKVVQNSKVLVMGVTFKENVPDARNSKVADLIRELQEYGIQVSVYDPVANSEEVKRYYGITLIRDIKENAPYDGIVVAVKHKEFLNMKPNNFKELTRKNPIVVDVKGIYSKKEFEKEFIYWRL